MLAIIKYKFVCPHHTTYLYIYTHFNCLLCRLNLLMRLDFFCCNCGPWASGDWRAFSVAWAGFQAYNPRLTHTKEDFILLMDEFFGLKGILILWELKRLERTKCKCLSEMLSWRLSYLLEMFGFVCFGFYDGCVEKLFEKMRDNFVRMKIGDINR